MSNPFVRKRPPARHACKKTPGHGDVTHGVTESELGTPATTGYDSSTRDAARSDASTSGAPGPRPTPTQCTIRPLPNVRTRIAATGVVLTLGLAGVVAPASVAQADCLGSTILAASGAELLRVSTLDVRSLGVNLPPLSDNRVSTGNSAVASNAATKARASADGFQGDLPLDKIGLPAAAYEAVTQSAPPHHEQPVSGAVADRDLGLIHSGAGELRALARWPRTIGCGEGAGLITSTYSSVGDVAVLPGAGTTSLLGMSTAFSLTGTETARTSAGTDGLGAHASSSVQDVYLMRGTPMQSRIRVISPPSLRVITDGTKIHGTVDYKSPVLEVNKPGGGVVRLDTPDKAVEYGLPSRSLLEGGGPLGGNPLSGILAPLLSKLGLPGLASQPKLEGLTTPSLPGALDPSLPTPDLAGTGLPDLGLDALGLPDLGVPGLPTPNGDAVEAADLKDALTVRISLGHVESKVYKRAVVAEAASTRVQVFAKVPGHADRVPVLDAGLGLLSAAVAVPEVAAYNESTESAESASSAAPSTMDGQTPETRKDVQATSGSLPLTGMGWLLTLLGVGALAVVIGRVIQLLARKRAAPSP